MKNKRITFGNAGVYRLAGGLALLLALSPAAATVEHAEFNRYEIILNRRPFGAAPPEAVPVPGRDIKPPPPPEFAARLKMVAITDRGGQVRVGFVDNSETPPKPYYLLVGDSQNGYQVISADYQRETAVVSKDGHEVPLSMSAAAGNIVASSGLASNQQSTDSARRSRNPQIGIKRSTLTRAQYEQEREAGIRGAPVAPHMALNQNKDAPSMADLPPEVREAAMRKYNMELIRAGGEKGIPLPIPLTPEEDDMLVTEGVLPPQ
jgi:hypothetical protein